MKRIFDAVMKFITEDTIAHDFNPWLVQKEMDIQKRFV